MLHLLYVLLATARSSLKPRSQTWRSFLRNHTQDLVSIDFFVVPTATFRILYVFLVLEHERRRVVHFNVTDGRRAASSRLTFHGRTTF